MNLILFDRGEIDTPLPRCDPRARHLLEVLRRQPSDSFDAGIVNGPRGKGLITALTDEALSLRFEWTHPAPASGAIHLIVGLPRPQTARDILREAATFGVGRLSFVTTEKGDANYARSTLWSSGEWRRHLLAGAEQAFDTRVPELSHGEPLAATLAALPANGTRFVLDNYESPGALSLAPLPSPAHVTLALGAERGWSAAERALLRQEGFAFVHLGARVFRTETACVAALTLIQAKLGLV